VVNASPLTLYLEERDLVPIVREAGWDPGLVWTDEENLSPHRIRSPDRPAHRDFVIPTELSRPTYYEGHLESKERFAIKNIY
jgi:hypothetical protein